MKTDYLISGAGASALSFLDVLLAETDATVVVVDRRDAPGGHWNDAYPFVRLHQSASFYGVNSRHLGAERGPHQDITDPKYELSTKSEILHYFHDLMENTYLPTGRVTYLRMSEHLGEGRVRHLLTGETTEIDVTQKIVEAGRWGDAGSIPATHTPSFEIAAGATCIPINDLPRYAPRHKAYTIIGAGKTGMDAAIWLLENGAHSDQITWVRPNDYWLLKRESILNHPARFDSTVNAFAKELEIAATVTDISQFCDQMEQSGTWHRIDTSVTPTRFHAAVCSSSEAAALAGIKNVIRKGHVTQVAQGGMTLVEGAVTVPQDTLFIDCSASAGVVMTGGFPPVFDGNTINLNLIRPFQPLFGAALIALLEAKVPDPEIRAACTHSVNFHDTPAEYIAQMLPAMMNQQAWSKVPVVKEWMERTRLQAMNHLMAGFDPGDQAKLELLGRFGPASKAAFKNIPNLLAASA